MSMNREHLIRDIKVLIGQGAIGALNFDES